MLAVPRTAEVLSDLTMAATGRRPLDLLVTGGSVLDVYRGSWASANVGVSHGRIVCVDGEERPAREVLDATGAWVVPGFFDPHFHAGGSHLTPARLAEALLARGTTSTACDFQEHYTVAGPAAVRAALDEVAAAGLRVFYMAPLQQFVVRRLGPAGYPMTVRDMLEMLTWPETVGINEPPPPDVLGGDPDLLRVIEEALRMGLIYAGHAPEVAGPMLEAYLASGASSDHESGTDEAAWVKLGLGMKLIMRQGSAARDLPQLVRLASEHPLASRHMSFGTDEVDPVDLESFGHQDGKVRYAIAEGVDPIVALQLASLNPAEYYRVDHEVGAIAPGRAADLVLLDDVDTVSIRTVLASGEVFERGAPRFAREAAACGSIVRYGAGITPAHFRLPAEGASAHVRVIELRDGSLVSGAGEASAPVTDGAVQSDPDRGLLKIAVIDRHTGSGDVGVGFVSGLGLKDGAVATTYQHPFFNVLAVGSSDEELALAANRIAVLGGGVVVVHRGEVIHEWPLPTVGVFAEGPLEQVVGEFTATNDSIRSLGCRFASPILTLAFAALPTIPAYGLSPQGLYDVAAERFVSVTIDGDAT